MELIVVNENDLSLRIDLSADNCPRLTYLGPGPAPEPPEKLERFQPLIVSGEHDGQRSYASKGSQTTLSFPGMKLKYRTHREKRNEYGLKLEMDLAGDNLDATVHWQFLDGLPMVRSWADLKNTTTFPVSLESVSSFFLAGLERSLGASFSCETWVYACAMGWFDELRWSRRTLDELGLWDQPAISTNCFQPGNAGTWSTKNHLPCGVIEGPERSVLWQIESNGSWVSDLGVSAGGLYIGLYGPREAEHHWHIMLKPGEHFTSVPACFGVCEGGFNEAMIALTQYRRRIRRPHWDNKQLPVIFNDYMHCLFADPTTERERPYIEAAAAAGAEIYVVDAGWYAKSGESWWGTIGEWLPSSDRFEGGVPGIMKEIQRAGMKPGLWLEIESMGYNCPLAREWPPECFFRRHGKPVVQTGRYQLDFRHPMVRSHADEVVDRLVNEYGAAYIKMDYNIDAGIGTEVDADSFGDGLLQHNRAYLDWIDAIFDRHPDLIIENCGSGGLRMDYALLTRHSIQSISDQEDAVKMARIAAAGYTGATPEQQAAWIYPQRSDNRERVILNCVNGMLMRMHLSGELAYLSEEGKGLIQEAVRLYKNIREEICEGSPFWPSGSPLKDASSMSAGLLANEGLYLAVWNFDTSAKRIQIDLAGRGLPEFSSATVLFPADSPSSTCSLAEGHMTAKLPAGPSARLCRIT